MALQQATPKAPPGKASAKKVERVIIIGPRYETEQQIGNPISDFRKDIRIVQISTLGRRRRHKSISEMQKGFADIAPLLERELKGAGPETMVISDVGQEPRKVRIEEIARAVKAQSDGAGVVLITSLDRCVGTIDMMEKFVLERGFDPSVLENIDYTFHWTGNVEVFPMIIQLYEDRMRYAGGKKQSILVVEDTPKYYTGFLVTLYEMTCGRVNLLLARTYEQAQHFVKTAAGKLTGAIVDMRFPRNGQMDEGAWRSILNLIKSYDPKVPVVLQSAEKRMVEEAKNEPRAFTIWKGSESPLLELRNIMRDYFGMGAFIFRDPATGKEIGRAETIGRLYEMVRTVPEQSLIYHASGNDISRWLANHGYYAAASVIKPIDSADAAYLRRVIREKLEPFLR